MEKDDMSLRVASFSYYLDTTKENLVHRISAQDQTTPTIRPPPFSIKFSKNNPQDNNNTLTNLRVDSFSYLNSSKDNFVFEIPGPIEDPTSAFTFSHEIPKDGEIGVFNADKYFNMKLEYKTEAKHKHKNDQVPERNNIGSNIKAKTPSLYSEVSSWNSQTALMPDFQRIGSTKQKKAVGRNFFTGFVCKGPCFDKKSVAQGAYFSSKPTRTGSERIDHLALIPVSRNENLTTKKPVKIESIDESRPSIEVFGSNAAFKGDIATNMERKLSMLTWDAIPKTKQLPTASTVGSSTIICDDMASEASSDLFEIENISGSIFPSITSELTDDVSTCMSPNSHYAPSEASIQWSVVTASAADYSVLSDYNDIETSVSVAGDLLTKNVKYSKTRIEGVQKSRHGGILGCKSQKSVDVAENIVCQKSKIDKVNLPRSFANGGFSYPSIL